MDRERALRDARQFYQAGKPAQAEQICAALLASHDGDVAALRLLGHVRLQQNRPQDALNLWQAALERDPSAAAHMDCALLFHRLGRSAEALASLDGALAGDPGNSVALSNRGNILLELGRADEALVSFDGSLALRPGGAATWNNRGNALRKLRRLGEALESYDTALRHKPDFAAAWNNRGVVLKELNRRAEADASFRKALAIHPDHTGALCNVGLLLVEAQQPQEALAVYDRVLAQAPEHVEALHGRGMALQQMRRLKDALASFETVLRLDPRMAEAWTGRGILLLDEGQIEQARDSFQQALALTPDDAKALASLGRCLWELGRRREALARYDAALRTDPNDPYAFGAMADAALHLCEWRPGLAEQLQAHVRAGHAVPGLTVMGYCDDSELQGRAASAFVGSRVKAAPAPLWTGTVYHHGRIRLAYVSGDFRQHATGVLMADLIEAHDRARFEVLGISFGSDESAMRARLEKGFDRMIDVRYRSQRDVALMLREMEIDIAIDVNALTRNANPELFVQRFAPVQVNYLAYPGTVGGSFLDYIIADPVVLPMDRQPFFHEKIVHLPDCYQPNDEKRAIAATAPTRAVVGLPEAAFVFCCFNAAWKIRPDIFDVWMRLLKAGPGSVLWLLEDVEASGALRREAAARGVDPSRLVFAPRMDLPDHLARHRLADLFLDTSPYNAHTTASDALWAGLPLVTYQGESFPARVGASVLTAAGLSELVTRTLEDYEALALRLARDRGLLGGVREKLAAHRDRCALFNTARYARHLEAAYTRMHEIARRGGAPEAFAV
jgi:predicted O-linked N-acetylglucosamine transferase (SPINDLY family)